MNETELLRWALADHAFKEADALTKHVIDSGALITPGEALYAACMTGIATSYYRPFVKANGLGGLPDEIEALGNFKGEKYENEFKTVHRMLRETRARVGGHFDRVFHDELHAKGEVAASSSEVTITLTREGAIAHVNTIAMAPAHLEFIRRLCLLQISRVAEKIRTFGAELLLKHKKLGKHRFRVSDKTGLGDIQETGLKT